MKILRFGTGKMGKVVAHIASSRGHEIVNELDSADVSIDFSHASCITDHVEKTCENQVPIIIGTTGWEDVLPLVQSFVEKSRGAALYSPNFSLGVAFFRRLLKQAHFLLDGYTVTGKESHHNHKKDAPSGTAKAIQEDLNMSTPFVSIRSGSIVGKHEVYFDAPEDTITLTHEAKNREGFALGAVKAAEWIVNKQGWFTLDDMLYGTDYPV